MAHESMKQEEARQGQVSEQLNHLEKAIEHLSKQVDRVEARLGPILRVVDEGESKAAMDEHVVPLAETIRIQAHRVNGQATRLIDVLERLEL